MQFSSIDKVEYSAEIEVKKSKFIAYCKYCENSTAAIDFVKEKSQKNATHNCYAFVTMDAIKAVDDGEPTYSAGMPILDCIRGQKLCNVVVLVTRYYGGIKLGLGGLIRAYAAAAKLVLAKAKQIEYVMCDCFEFETEYANINATTNCINRYGKILNAEYLAKTKINVAIKEECSNLFKQEINDLSLGKIDLIPLGKEYVNI